MKTLVACILATLIAGPLGALAVLVVSGIWHWYWFRALVRIL